MRREGTGTHLISPKETAVTLLLLLTQVVVQIERGVGYAESNGVQRVGIHKTRWVFRKRKIQYKYLEKRR